MAEQYSFGWNRIFYRSTGFKGVLTKVDFLDPSLFNHISVNPIKNVDDIVGLYYVEYTFDQEGIWVGIFEEEYTLDNGTKSVKKTSQNFRIVKEPEFRGGFRLFLGDNVINT